jgi:tRNA pseudouridine38-40 synthase
MPDDIAVTWAQPVADEFHARFSALSRSYCYVILNSLVRSALNRHRAWWVYQPLDADLMNLAAQAIAGRHDFSAFRAAGCQASTATREIFSISVAREGDRIYLDVTANAFLQHMVRNITGTLVAIGAEELPVESMRAILDSRDRKQGGVAAPPHGLTLVSVAYPDEFRLPKKVNMPV